MRVIADEQNRQALVGLRQEIPWLARLTGIGVFWTRHHAGRDRFVERIPAIDADARRHEVFHREDLHAVLPVGNEEADPLLAVGFGKCAAQASSGRRRFAARAAHGVDRRSLRMPPHAV